MPIDTASMDVLLAKMNAIRETLPRMESDAVGKSTVPSIDFASTLKASLDRVDASQKTSADLAQRFQLGDTTVSLEETMVAMAKANLSFQQMVQVRNKVIAAYHDIMNMPV